MRIALLCSIRPDEIHAGLPDDLFEEYDSRHTIESIATALRSMGHEVQPLPADSELPHRLSKTRYDFAFNIAEGKGRRGREAIAASICELFELPFTGSDSVSLGITLDKHLAKRVVSPEVPVARGLLVETEEDEHDLGTMPYPVIVKPNDEGSSKGIRDNPVFADAKGAAARCRWLRANYDCSSLVEEYLPGTEVTIGIAGNGSGSRVLGLMEIAPADTGRYFVYSIEVKRDWRNRVRYHIPPRLDSAILDAIRTAALTAYRLLGCRDIARMDFRLDRNGIPRFIECNPLPGLDPQYGDIVILSREILSYETLVQNILLAAVDRVRGRTL